MSYTYPFVQDYNVGQPFALRRTDVYPHEIVESREAEIDAACLPAGGPFTLHGSRGKASVILDFGEARVGRVHLRIRCPSDCQILIYYGEVLSEALRSTPYTAGWYTLPTDEFQLTPGLHERVSQGRRAFRFMRLCLPALSADVNVLELKVETVEYPVKPVGQFRCSNERLNAIWEIARRTTRLCMQQFYEDGIKRDGLLWIGDYRVQFLCNVGAFGDAALARRSLLMIAASQRSDGAIPACAGRGGGHQHPHLIDYMPGIPSGVDSWIVINYCADYLCAVDEYIRHTGDDSLLTELQPCLQRLVRFLTEDFDSRKHDLLATPYFSIEVPTFFADNCCGFSSRATLYAQLIRALDCGASLATQLRDGTTTDACRKARKTLATAFREHCIDPKTHTLHDETNDKEHPHAASWCAPAFATLAGLINTGDDARRALLSAWADPEAVTPVNGYSEFFFLAALFAQNLAAEALVEMERYWGAMLDYGLTTCAEGFNRKTKNYFATTLDHTAPGSFCHGWSAGPAYLLPAMVLGITPLKPGYQTVCVQPALGNLEWAEGDVPTPQGVIRVRWEQTERLKGRILLPPGISGVVRPSGNRASDGITLHEGWNDVGP